MTNEQHANGHDRDEARRLDSLISGGHTVAMVMTMVGDTHTSRPVTCVEVAHDRLSFLVSREVDWVSDIVSGKAVVHVTVADEKKNTYLSLEGRATLVTDAAETQRLWTPVAKVWFTGADDPRLGVLRFDVTRGQYWDGPSGSIRQGLNLVLAMIESDEARLGTSGPVNAT